MGDFKFAREKMADVLSGLGEYQVLAPLMTGGVVRFREVEESDVPVGERGRYDNTVVPPKELMFPETETLFRYQLGGTDINVSEPEGDTGRVVIGIRPCDAQAFAIVDRVFGWDYPDPYYQKRRENTTLVGLACDEPCSNCFCPSVGGGPASEEYLDAIMYNLDDTFYLKTITKKGEELARVLSGVLQEAGDAEKKAAKKQAEEATSRIVRSIDTDGIPEKLPSLYGHPFWEQFSDRCLGCGICTYLCPTCHCFDIQDEVEHFDGRRARMWDTCMFKEYSLHASGHNPRPTRKERTRNRISHKYSYFPLNFDVIACVGCGRCINYCPVNIDILDVLEKSREAEVKEEKPA
ncbi:MAG: 4Fe-4S dicluster domain-containing protein [Actinobacteria bacterium]|nr:4Fe-4S dicluster domain-containing protein [Actinomycetota bacterium]